MSWLFSFRIFWFGIAMVASTTLMNAAPTGFVEGHLKVISPPEVDLADKAPSSTMGQNYADYPLIILTKDERKELARVTADENGHYRTALPPGDYVMDVQGRGRGHVRAKPQQFSIAPNQTVHVDMEVDTGVR
jgi:hypothetical protein